MILEKSFLEKYKQMPVQWGGALGYVTFLTAYSRLKDDGQKEDWVDCVARVVNGIYDIQVWHCHMHDRPFNKVKAARDAHKMFELIFHFKFLPPGRGLWAMGTKAMWTHGAGVLNNCFRGNTEFITKKGVVTFEEVVGTSVDVLDGKGDWVTSPVKAYGEQKLHTYTFKSVEGRRTHHRVEVQATSNHGWPLRNGSTTTNLAVGDVVVGRIADAPLNNEYGEGFVHGLIFADGSTNKEYTQAHSIRLCGRKKEHRSLLREHPSFYSESEIDGDPYISLRSTVRMKELPTGSLSYNAGFLDAWMDMDGHTEPYGRVCLDSIHPDAYGWLQTHAAACGYTISGSTYEVGDTNYGPRTRPLGRFILDAKAHSWKVESIKDEEIYETVYCVEVPTTHSFTLASGIHSLNCGFFSTKDMSTKPFKLLMHFSMLGVGVGFDTKGAGTRFIQRPSKGEIQIKIADDREGWVNSVDLLLDTYFNGGPTPIFDYGLIRPKGAVLKTFGGTASGPGPLIKLHDMLRTLNESYIGKVIDTEWLADVGNMIGVCVEMGGIRRSAEIIFGEYGDKSFYNLKNDIELVKSHRYMSNNSVKCIPGCDYTEIVKAMRKTGDPGIYWLHNAQRYGRMNGIMDPSDFQAEGANPCIEQTLWDKELCNLVETFPGRHDNLHSYLHTLKFAYWYAKVVTLMKTGFKEVDDVIAQNRRIGTSQTGIIKAFNLHGRYTMLDWSDKGYDYLTGLDADFSCWFGVNRSIKRTSIKPSGTVPLLCGETGALNYPISEYYHRTIRLAENNPLLPRLEAAGYHIEDNQYGKSNDSKTMVVYFPMKTPRFTRGQADVSMWEQLENAAAYQRYWADNQVSTTIAFNEKEADDIPTALEMYQDKLKAVCFFPQMIEFHGQAPYQPITQGAYHNAVSKKQFIDFSNLGATAVAPSGCDSAGCEV